MEYVTDLILLLLFTGMIVTGAVKGFVKTVLGMVALLAAVFAAYQLSAILAPAIYDSILSKRVLEAIGTKLADTADANAAAQQVSAVMASIPKFVINIAASIGIDINGISGKINSLDNTSASITKELADSIAAPIITAVVHAILFVIILALVYILLMIVAGLIDKFFKLPVLKSANRIMGGLLGAVKGAVLVFVICVILEIISGFGKGNFIAQIIEPSKIAGFVNDHSFIINNFRT